MTSRDSTVFDIDCAQQSSNSFCWGMTTPMDQPHAEHPSSRTGIITMANNDFGPWLPAED